MGSFNTSCFASRQTIAPGDKCIIIPIIQASGYEPVKFGDQSAFGITDSNCYPDRYWKPLWQGFRATYDDYGQVSIDEAERPNLYWFLINAIEHIPVVVAGENRFHDLPLDLSDIEISPNTGFLELHKAWDSIFNVAAKYRAFWNAHGKYRPMQFAILSEISYRKLIQITEKTFSHTHISLKLSEYIETTVTNFSSSSVLDIYDDFRCVGGSLSIPSEAAWSSFITLYKTGKISLNKFVEAIKPHLEFRWMMGGLEALNLHFEPLVYTGQDYSNEIGKNYVKFVVAVEQEVSPNTIDEFISDIIGDITENGPDKFDISAYREMTSFDPIALLRTTVNWKNEIRGWNELLSETKEGLLVELKGLE